MLESELERYLVKKIEQIGGLCWKFTSPGNAGVPDRIIMYRGHTVFAELKKPNGGVLGKLQIKQLNKLSEQLIPNCLINSKKDVDVLVGILKETIQLIN